jgi:hypothetical protein
VKKEEPEDAKQKASYIFDHFGDSISSSASNFRNRNLEFKKT